LAGEIKALRIKKFCPGSDLSITNPTSTDVGLNPDRGNEKPATNCLNYDTATYIVYLPLLFNNREEYLTTDI
jgi:hypothetical protein